MEKTTCIIVDDEEAERLNLLTLLNDYDFITVTAQAANGQQGLKLLEQNLPDLIFIDVAMPVMDGFTMLAKIKKQPKIIFTTVNDVAIIKSFKENGLAYLLKPIKKEDLAKSLADMKKTHQPMALSLKTLFDNLNNQ